MKRRHFVQQLGALGIVSLLPQVAWSNVWKTNFKLGLQLFSVNDDMVRDPIGTLKEVKSMGYRDFEIYGFDPDKLTYYGIPASEFKSILDDMGLTVTSGHYGFSPYLRDSQDSLDRYVDQCIAGAKALNSPYITWPWMDPADRNSEGFKLMSEKLNIIGEQVSAADLGFAYHNHGYEFDDLGGTNGYEIVLERTDPNLVKLQMDLYWVMHAAVTTPKELVERQPGRYVMRHIKDMHKESRDYTELGNGSIDYHSILPDPKKSGLEFYYIEQGGNFARSPLQSAAASAAYFKKNLSQYL